MRDIQSRFSTFQSVPATRPQQSEPARNVRPTSTTAFGLPNPSFGNLLQTELARYSTQGLPWTGQDDRTAGGLGSLASLLGLAPGALGSGKSLFGSGLGSGYGLGGSMNPSAGLGSAFQGASSAVHKYNPFRDLEVTSPFGVRELRGRSEDHSGTDYRVLEGTPLPAIGPGRVAQVGEDELFGRNVVYRLDTGEVIRYAHLSDKAPFVVVEGQRVAAGDILGISGTTGLSTGPHVHVSVQIAGQYVDPQLYLSLLP